MAGQGLEDDGFDILVAFGFGRGSLVLFCE